MAKASYKVTRDAQRQQQRAKSSGATWWIVGIIGAIVVVSVFLVIYLPSRPITVLDGVQTYNNLARDHSETAQIYAQTPPVGGVHSSAWQNCGVYDQPVKNENAVHSLEHGAVWITYRPDLPQDAVNRLRNLARGQTHVLVSPYPDLPAPVVATAWGLQLPVDDANDQRLSLFVSRYAAGPQTPEPGALCSGGVGTPTS
jgi:hypothetical protein